MGTLVAMINLVCHNYDKSQPPSVGELRGWETLGTYLSWVLFGLFQDELTA